MLVAGLAGCITLPGQLAPPDFVSRVVDRGYDVVWVTVLAALRNEGAGGFHSDRDRGVIETGFRFRPGTPVRVPSLLGERDTRGVPVDVRYAARVRALGPERTEVGLRIEVHYVDRATGTAAPVLDDGTLSASFWRRFEQDLTYYGARPETWRPEGPPSGPVATP